MSNADKRWKYAQGPTPRKSCTGEGRLAMYHPLSGRMTVVLVGCDVADTCKGFLKKGKCVLAELEEHTAHTRASCACDDQ